MHQRISRRNRTGPQNKGSLVQNYTPVETRRTLVLPVVHSRPMRILGVFVGLSDRHETTYRLRNSM